MQSNRPTSVLVLAIFHFILGGLGLLGGLFGLGSAVIVYAQSPTSAPPPAAVRPAGPGGMTVAAQNQFLNARLPYWKEIGILFNLIDSAISVLMIAAGVGLVRMRPWGRTCSFVYGGVSIVSQVGRLVYTAGFFLPAMSDFYESLTGPASGLPPGFGTIMKYALIGGVAVSLLGFVYPIIVLVLLSRRSVRAAFSGVPVGGEEDPYDRGGPPREGDYDRPPPGYGGEPDDRFGSAPQ